MYNTATPKLLTVQVAALRPTVSSTDFSEGSLGCARPGPASTDTTSTSLGALTHKYECMRLPGGRLAVPNNRSSRRKYPGIQNNYRDEKALESNYTVQGSTFKGRDVASLARLPPDNNSPEKDTCGKHFLFDKKWKDGRVYPKYDFRDAGFLRLSGCVPPMPPHYHVHRSGYLHRFSPRKQLSHAPAWPLTLGACEGYDLTLGTAALLPSAISIKGSHPLYTDGCKHRPRVINRTGSLFAIGTQQKTQTYPDPVSGAPASFVQRLSEITSLEGETVRQEKIKKLKRSKKQES